jgi:hypothetical protein
VVKWFQLKEKAGKLKRGRKPKCSKLILHKKGIYMVSSIAMNCKINVITS